MKIFFFLLLFINISLFLWEHNMISPGKDDSRKADNRIAPGIEKIVLVSEVQQAQTNSDNQDRKDSTEDSLEE